MGGSKPGKAFEQTNYAGGLHNYGEGSYLHSMAST
jgi:hypothetical protein